MIANITAGNSFKGLIMYNEKKVQKGTAERLSGVLNLNQSSKQIIEYLEYVASAKPDITNKTFHVSLAFAESDTVFKDVLADIADDYMKEMGYKDTPYIVYRHNDTGIDHIHIVSTRVTFDGDKVSDSMERYRSQRVTRKLELDYGITVVSSLKQSPDDLKTSKGNEDKQDVINTKHAISIAIDHVLNTDKATSYEEFVRSLLKRNVVAQLVKVDGEGNNLVTPGIMYSLGRKVTPETKRIKGSSFHKGYTYSKILDKVNTNLIIAQTKPVSERSKAELKKATTAILTELKSPSMSTIADLDRLFAKYQLEAVYFKNSGGIYGLKIKDLTSNEVYKASDIDRGFSWNVIKKLLDGTDSNQEQVTPNEKVEIPFIVNVSSDPDDKPLVWIKSPVNKAVIASPLNRAMDTLAMRGFVSQDELQTELKKIGFKAIFNRDFSKNSGGITGVAFTELSTGNTYSGSSLSPKSLSWSYLSNFVASDHKESNFENYVNTIFSKWGSLPVTGQHGRIEDFVVFLNQNGLTLSKYNQVDYISQVGGNVRVPVDDVVLNTKNKEIFNFRQPILTKESVNTLYDVGYLHEPLNPVERLMLASIYDNNRAALLKQINTGSRIDLRSVSVLAQGKQGVDTYKALTNVQQQIARTLEFALYSNNALQVDDPKARVGIDTFVQSLNKRGVGVCFDLDEANKANNIRFHLKGFSDAVLIQNELPDFIDSGKFNQLIDLSSSEAYKTMLDQLTGYAINYTERQVELFKALETDNSHVEFLMISQGIRLKLSDMEESYFEMEDTMEQVFEESHHQNHTFIKESLAFIDALAQVAQGEIPVSRDPRKQRRQNGKRRPRMGY